MMHRHLTGRWQWQCNTSFIHLNDRSTQGYGYEKFLISSFQLPIFHITNLGVGGVSAFSKILFNVTGIGVDVNT